MRRDITRKTMVIRHRLNPSERKVTRYVPGYSKAVLDQITDYIRSLKVPVAAGIRSL